LKEAQRPLAEREGNQGRSRLLHLASAFLLLLHLTLSLAPAAVQIRNDFASYYVPARAALEGRSLDRAYEWQWFRSEAARVSLPGLGSFVPHPPANALLLMPLAWLAPQAAKTAWTLLLASAYALAFVTLLPRAEPRRWLALCFLVPSASLANALLYGQPYPLLLLLLAAALAAFERGRPMLAGLLLSPVLVLKLYALPFVLRFARERSWRALAGVALGALLWTGVGVALLGPAVHERYAREVLAASLDGRVQDPYSPIWGSWSSLVRRLLQHEPDLNPAPAADAPRLASALARTLPAAIVLGLLLPAPSRGDNARRRRLWAALVLGSLAASPLTSSYHFVLLVLPVALLTGQAARGRTAAALLAALAFATSPAPHYFARFAEGWGNLLAYPRLAVLLALLACALRPLLSARQVAAALIGSALAGLTALAGRADSPRGMTRVPEARGYFAAEPLACGGGLFWLAVEHNRLVLRGARLGPRPAPAAATSLRCADGQPAFAAGGPSDARRLPGDSDRGHGVEVRVDTVRGRLIERDDATGEERVLVTGELRHPRLSPAGRWVAFSAWRNGSWDVEALERSSGRLVRVAAARANEREPAWLPGGAIVFASDWRRGLESTALYAAAGLEP
jgi:hypothetical protein